MIPNQLSSCVLDLSAVRGVPRAGARATTRGGCQYPTRCPGGFRTVTRKCSLCGLVCAQRDRSGTAKFVCQPSLRFKPINRVIPWCGVAPVGFFPSREAGGAGGGLQPGRDQPRPTGIWQHIYMLGGRGAWLHARGGHGRVAHAGTGRRRRRGATTLPPENLPGGAPL